MKTTVNARQRYQESAIGGATPIELVILLYDSAIEDMRRALAAMQNNEVENRSTQIAHALMVLQQLQGTLDFERGGSPARQLEQFYNLVRAKLLEAQIRGSGDLMRQQIHCMSEVRDGWAQARRLLQPVNDSPAAPTPTLEGGSTAEWSA